MAIQISDSFSRFMKDMLGNNELSKEAYFMLANSSDDFLKNRTVDYLKKIKDTHISFRKKLLALPADNLERKVLFKFFKARFSDSSYSKTLGIALAFNFFSEYERFEFKHFSQVLKKQVSGIRVTEDSFYLAAFPKEKTIFCYIELEKIRGKHLILSEYLKLRDIFIEEISAGIEFSSPNLFTPKNDEETYKNIARLNYELDDPKDLPIAMISFSSQNFDKLSFSIILIRILKSKNTPIKALIEKLCLKVQFQIQKLNITLSKHMKEISMFTIELNSSLFFRRNHLVDLLKARQYVSTMLKEAIGEFRDYNGGLLSKQTEQFDSIKKKFKMHVKDFAFYEELFFSLAPSSLQPLISPESALQFFELFSKIKSTPLNGLYELQSFKSANALSIIVKTTSTSIRSFFEDLILDDSMTIATIIKTIDQQFYCCLLQLSPFDLSLLKQVELELSKLKDELKISKKTTFNLPFQEGCPNTIHPHFNTDNKDATICKSLFEGLTRMNLNEEPELALAKKIEISKCKKKYYITLRESKWSNGEPVTSFHFAMAWKKAISFGSKCVRANRFFLIKNAKKIYLGKESIENIGIKTPSKNELIIELEYSSTFFLQLLADPAYSPLYEISNQEPTIFNGPFLIESLNPVKKMVLIANSLYWDAKAVHLKKVRILFEKDISKIISMFKENELDWIGSPLSVIPENAIKHLKNPNKLETYGVFWLFCNTKNPKLKSSKIRKALSYAIDRADIIKKILPHQRPNYSIIPENLSQYKSKDSYLNHSLIALNQLFEQGLKESNLKRDQFSLNLLYSKITPEREILAKYLKKCWERIFKIKVNLVEKEYDAFFNDIYNSEYEIGGYCVFSACSDPNYFLELFNLSQTNFSSWENPIFQKYISLAKQIDSLKKRNEYLKMAEKFLLEEMPVIPIYNHNHLYFREKTLKNFLPHKLVYADFKWVYFDE